MSNFDAYDEEFQSECQKISNGISELRESVDNDTEKVATTIREIDGLISRTTKLLKQMDLEVCEQEAGTKKVLKEKMTLYRNTLLSHRSDFER